jgi:glycosyltransferase involved in cell wall biosynthesis
MIHGLGLQREPMDSEMYDFIFVSRLIVESKGVELLLAALQLCDDEGYEFSVAICGAGPLSEKIAMLNFQNIKLIYLGYLDDIVEVLSVSSTALSLQKYENYPSQFLLEALAAGCNIIATDVGDTRLLLSSDIATLIDGTAESLKIAMTSVYENRTAQSSLAVQRVLEQHSVSTFSHYMERVITEART